MRSLRRALAPIGLAALVVAALVLCALALIPRTSPQSPGSSRSPASSGASSGSASTSAGTAAPLRLAVYGDQVTLGGAGTLRSAGSAPRSWTDHLGSGIRVVGGTALPQGTTEQVVQQARPVDADLHVAFLGISDAYAGSSPSGTVDGIGRLAQQIDPSPASSFVVVALGPGEGLSADALQEWNDALQRAARQHDWTYVDPWEGLRTDDFTWAGSSLGQDRTTPTEAGARRLGSALTTQLRSAQQASGSPSAASATDSAG